MSILNKYKQWPLRLVVNRSNIMDIVVSDDTTPSGVVERDGGKLSENNLIAYIDSSNIDSINIEDGRFNSIESKDNYYYENNNQSKEDIFLYDFDLTAYDNYLLNIEEDNSWVRESGVTIESGDTKVTLYPVGGESGITYNNNIITFNGGFLQGFYKLYGFDYETLPQYIENGEWNLEFLIKPSEEQHDEAIFYYMGTRAENKFAELYNSNFDIISEATTSNGVLLNNNQYWEMTTDNKYLDSYMSGYTRDYNTLSGNNAYLLFNQTTDGYTTENIDEFYKSDKYVKPQYNVLNDLYYNAFALFITKKGKIGYKYFVNKCKENDFIESGVSGDNVINFNEWNTINVKIKVFGGDVDECGVPFVQRNMKIYFYVNGLLKYISKELPEFDFRQLNDIKEKQEGVPFNISIGGGTLGLVDSVIKIDDEEMSFEDPKYLSSEFNKRFYGDFKTFKFYNGPLTITEIRNNYQNNLSVYYGD